MSSCRATNAKGATLIGQSRFAAAAMWAEAILSTLYPPKGSGDPKTR